MLVDDDPDDQEVFLTALNDVSSSALCMVAADGDRRDRLRAEPPDPIEVDQHVQRLEEHRDQHEAGRLEKVPRQRTGGEVLHVLVAPGTACP